ncbi:toprim domain-containing protein [Orientia tsutsugamushi]|uniref:DUF7146 domain-containing protein n=1 Tax=Orientia tsutsugamushi TaxID=784 RepID=UPI0002FDABA6|nr:toprim domain-containing protein [Orientia tsutsugamushi]
MTDKINNSNNHNLMEELRNKIASHAETIACDLLGEPNKHFSRRGEIRWGDTGKIVVNTSGKHAGKWYDFSSGEGGDLFDLARKERGGDFVKAKEYLTSMVGITSYKQNYQRKETTQNAAQNELAKIRKVQYFYNQSSPLYFTNNTEVQIVKRYLEQHRGIDCFTMNSDLRASVILDRETNENYPAFSAFSRNAKGKITGVQVVYLNSQTCDKADISVPRRAFGKISESFVRITPLAPHDSPITIITEGVETALSLKQAGINGKIIAAIGIHNFKNYQPFEGENIIIAADNDGQNSITMNTVDKAKKTLENSGAKVLKVMPTQEGDFNDLLQIHGAEAIRQIIIPEIAKLIKLNEIQNKSSEIPNQSDVKELYAKSLPLYDYNKKEKANAEVTTVNKFLENHTEIYSSKIFDNPNLRANMVFDEETQKSWPALTIFVKNEKGEITGAEILALNSKTCNKADIPEKSIGTISGSFAEIAQQNSDYSPITILTDNTKTALSIKHAGVEGKILCAIEAENLQNYNPESKEKIILAVKNDVNTEKAEKVLEDKGAIVCTVKNDFNNVLKTQDTVLKIKKRNNNFIKKM